MKLNPAIERLLYVLLAALALIALGMVASSDSASNFVTVNAVYQGF
jgi:hypothetical protein